MTPALILSLLLAAPADPPAGGAPARILEDPSLLTIAGAPLAGDRLFPSPAAHDFDGEGTLELAIGDLWGRITIARRAADGVATEWGVEAPLLDGDGKRLDFHNW